MITYSCLLHVCSHHPLQGRLGSLEQEMSGTQTDFLTVTSHYIISWIDRHATHGSTYPCQLYVQDYSLSCSLKRF